MINLAKIEVISPIFLIILLIVYLIIVETGYKKARDALLPFLLVLAIVFVIISLTSIYTIYMDLR